MQIATMSRGAIAVQRAAVPSPICGSTHRALRRCIAKKRGAGCVFASSSPAAAVPGPPLVQSLLHEAPRSSLQPFDPLRPSFVLGHLRAEWPSVAAALVALVGCTAVCVAAPLLSSRYFESLIGVRPDSVAISSVAGLLALYCMEPLFTLVYVRSVFAICEKAFETIRRETFRAVLIQRVSFFDAHTSSELAAVLAGELGSLRSVLADNVSRDRGLRAACEALTTVGVLAVLSPHLAPVLIMLVASVAVSAALFTRRSVQAFGKDVAVMAQLTEAATRIFSAIRVVRAFGGERRALELYAEGAAAARSSGLGLGEVKSRLEGVNRACIYASLFTLYAWGGYLVRAGIVPVGTILASIGCDSPTTLQSEMYTFILIFGVQGCVYTCLDVARARGALDRIKTLLNSSPPDAAFSSAFPEGMSFANLPAAASPEEAAAVRAAAAGGDLELRSVRFSYPTRPEVEVLGGLDLLIPRGKVTALVGRSGAGKSTVAQLLARFYEPQSGALLLGGAPLDRFSTAAWAAAYAYVPQEPVLFATSIRDNIAFGAATATSAQVEAAAEAANVMEFAAGLPKGLDTMVGERGASLSGGQRQRVAIARAILKDAPVLILDEATSALDAISEQAVQAALQRLATGRTVVVVAHRLSTIRNAAQIVVLQGGVVVEAGTHEELMASVSGSYRDLVAGAAGDEMCFVLDE